MTPLGECRGAFFVLAMVPQGLVAAGVLCRDTGSWPLVRPRGLPPRPLPAHPTVPRTVGQGTAPAEYAWPVINGKAGLQ
jgi:hypothetical protein